MNKNRKAFVWVAVAAAILIPLGATAMSPQLAWRGPIYILAGFAGVTAMTCLLLQPLLIGGYLSGFSNRGRRRTHAAIGSLLILAVLVHVVGLWFTSAPDVIDALLFRSPTAFSAWGVGAMWTAFAAAFVALLKRRIRLKPHFWRVSHTALAVLTVVGSVVHAMLIEGSMETISKAALCGLVVIATVRLLFDRHASDAQGRK